MVVYIVLNLDCGWDNIVGVFMSDDVSYEQLEKHFSDKCFYIKRQFAYSDLDEFY